MASENNGDLIVRILKSAGVEVVFGIISIHNIPIYDAIARQGGIRAIPSRSEPGAVNMADGYARATGKLGVAITSTGSGAGNAAGAMVEALNNGTPLLHITGQIDVAQIDQNRGYIHEARDQLTMLKAVSKEAFRVRSAATVGATIQAAIEAALTPPFGPVSVEIPIDLQKAPIENPPTYAVRPTQPPSFDKSVIVQAAEILKNAKRPIIWSGSGTLNSGAAQELTQLAEILGAGVFTSQAGRGAIPEDHPQCIGNFGVNPAVRDFLKSADVLLAVGTRLRGQETLNWTLPLPATQIQIDADPKAISRSYPATVGVVGDAKGALQALIGELKGQTKPDAAFLDDIANARKAGRAAVRATLGPYEQIVDDLRAGLNRDAILVRDVTISASSWGSRLFPIYEPRKSIHAAAGGIGQGLQMGLGVKLGQPDKQVVILAGDGGFMVNCGEMATAVQEKLPVVLLLFNDGGYGVLRNIQNAQYERRVFAVDLHNPDFSKLCEAFGWQHTRITATADFKGALASALTNEQPTMLEIDMTAIGDFAIPFGGPPAPTNK